MLKKASISLLGLVIFLSTLIVPTTFASTEVIKHVILDDFEDDNHIWEATSARANHVSMERTKEKSRFGEHSLKISYDFIGQQGTSGVYANIKQPSPLAGTPKKISMWVYGDDSGHWLRGQMKDATGQYFHLDYAASLNWSGWKYVEAEIPEGWKAPYTLDLPVRYMATDDTKKNKGAIYIDDLRVIYEDDLDEDVTNPEIHEVFPQGLVDTGTPLIEATVSDTQSIIESKNSKLTVDGQMIDLELVNDTLQGQVSEELTDGLHHVELTVAESAGNTTTTSWSFHVNTGKTNIAITEKSELLLSGKSYEAQVEVKELQVINNMSFDLSYDSEQASFKQPVTLAKGVTVKEQEKGKIKVNIDAQQTENELIIPLSFHIESGAKGEFLISLSNGQMIDNNQKIQSFYHEGLTVMIEQPLRITATPYSVGSPTIFQVTDYKGKAVQGANIRVEKSPNLLKVVKDATIYKGGSGIRGDEYEKVKAGTYLYYTNAPTESFPFYRVYMKNGEVRYFHLPEEVAIKQELEELLPLSDMNGKITTPLLSLAKGLIFELTAEKKEESSDLLSITITKDFGSELPKAVTRSFTGDITKDAKWSWRTNVATTDQYLQVKDKKTNKIIQQIPSHSQFVSTLNGDFTMHHASIKGLSSEGFYTYRVGHDNTGWTEEQNFTLIDRKEKVSFLFATDSQAADVTGFRYWTELMKMGLNKLPEAQFIMHGGDIVDNGNDMNEWEAFFDASENVIDHLPFMATIGNHEVYGKGAEIYRSLFDYELKHPEQMAGDVYSYDLNGVRFITLNTESGEENMRKQAKWLEEEVQSAGNLWTVVTMHRAPYPSNPLGGGSELSASIFTPVIERTGVDLVLLGHDHSYMRTLPMKEGKPSSNGQGTTYVIGGSAGPKFYPEMEKEYTAHLFGEDVQVVTAIEIDENKLSGKVYTIDGKMIDNFELNKLPKETIQFNDIRGVFSEKEIIELAEKNIIKGKSKTKFDPGASVTRAEFAVFVARALNLPLEEVKGTFKDVHASHPFAPAIEAANRVKIINGKTSQLFSPSSDITRQEMAAILVRAAKYQEITLNPSGSHPNPFKDDSQIGLSLKDEVYQAVQLELIKGNNGKFYPLHAAKRSEAAAMIHRLLNQLSLLK